MMHGLPKHLLPFLRYYLRQSGVMVQLVKYIPNISSSFDAGKCTESFLILANTNVVL